MHNVLITLAVLKRAFLKCIHCISRKQISRFRRNFQGRIRKIAHPSTELQAQIF